MSGQLLSWTLFGLVVAAVFALDLGSLTEGVYPSSSNARQQ